MASRTPATLSLVKIVHHDDIVLPQDRDDELLESRLGAKFLQPSIGESNTQGAAISPTRSAATNVVVFQCPIGTLDTRRWPRGQRP